MKFIVLILLMTLSLTSCNRLVYYPMKMWKERMRSVAEGAADMGEQTEEMKKKEYYRKDYEENRDYYEYKMRKGEEYDPEKIKRKEPIKCC